MSEYSEDLYVSDNASDPLSKISDKNRKRYAKKKVLAEWDDDSIGKLISNVRTRECLWNTKLKEYRHKNQREAAWNEIFDIFEEKYPVIELIAKWANLRIQFRSYTSKFKNYKSSQGANEYKVNWRFFKPMLFIKSDERDQSTNSESNLSFEELPRPSGKGFKKNEVSAHDFGLRKRKTEPTSSTNGAKKMAVNSMNQTLKKTSKEENDEFKIFGNFIATELRKIPQKRDAHKIQRKMQRILLDFMDELDDMDLYTLP